MTNPQSWFLDLQQQIMGRVGEPVLLSIRMCFDDWFEVEVNTFTDRWGTAADRDVETAIDDAVDMLLQMDEVIAEVTSKRAASRSVQEE